MNVNQILLKKLTTPNIFIHLPLEENNHLLPSYILHGLVQCDTCGKPNVLRGVHYPNRNFDQCLKCYQASDVDGKNKSFVIHFIPGC